MTRAYPDRAAAGADLARRLVHLLASDSAPTGRTGSGGSAKSTRAAGNNSDISGESPRAASRAPVVLALPRGGVPVAAPVADALDAPLHVLVVRKLGLPRHPELGAGAIAEDGTVVLDHDLIARARVPDDAMAAVIANERAEIARRVQTYRDGRPAPELSRRTVLLIDDGLARGVTAHAAALATRHLGASNVWLAVPVGSADAVAVLSRTCDRVTCPWQPADFGAVGRYYHDFRPVNDADVRHLLHLPPAP